MLCNLPARSAIQEERLNIFTTLSEIIGTLKAAPVTQVTTAAQRSFTAARAGDVLGDAAGGAVGLGGGAQRSLYKKVE